MPSYWSSLLLSLNEGGIKRTPWKINCKNLLHSELVLTNKNEIIIANFDNFSQNTLKYDLLKWYILNYMIINDKCIFSLHAECIFSVRFSLVSFEMLRLLRFWVPALLVFLCLRLPSSGRSHTLRLCNRKKKKPLLLSWLSHNSKSRC